MDKRIEEIEEQLKHPDFLTKQENGLFLNKRQIQILERNQIEWKSYSSMHSLLFEVENVLLEEENEELERLANELQDFSYYYETKK